MSVATWENETSPNGAGNTIRALTHSSDLTREGLAMKATRECAVAGCEKPMVARGWCTAHWTRWKRHGDPLAGGPARSPQPDTCFVEGCDGKPRARGLCAAHWRREMGEADPEWREASLAKRRAWHASNPERVAETRKRSRERHGEAANARTAKWREENPHLVLMDNWVGRRRRYGLSDAVTEVVHPDVVFERDGGFCQLCLEPVDPTIPAGDPISLSIDHITPVVDPACEHSYANTQLAHLACNSRKSARAEGPVATRPTSPSPTPEETPAP